MTDPILVVGLPGSGLSEVTRMLDSCGVHIKGTAVSELNQRLIYLKGVHWYVPPQLPSGWASDPALDQFKREALNAAPQHATEAYWGWADTDTAFTLELWQALFPNLRLVICLRHPLEHAPELVNLRDGLDFDTALGLWHTYYQHLDSFTNQAVVTHFDAYLKDAPGELKRILSLLNAPCTDEEIASAASIFKQSHAESVEIPAGVEQTYQQWVARSGDIYQAQANEPDYQAKLASSDWKRTQAERAGLLQQNRILQHDAANFERTFSKLNDAIVYMAEGRLRRLKRRIKNSALYVLSGGKSTAPALPLDFPEICLVTVLDSGSLAQPRQFDATLRAVAAQTSPNWQWIIAAEEHRAELIKFSKQEKRIQLLTLPPQQTRTEQWNAALERVNSPYLMLLFPEDRLEEAALAEAATILRDQPDTDAVYSDATFTDNASRKAMPFFKPDWSPMMMFSINLLEGLFVFKRELLNQIENLNPELDDAYWDFCWRIGEKAQKIHHIPTLLCHCPRPLETSVQAQAKVQAAHLSRLGIQPQNTTPPRWNVSPTPMVSIIIPSRDQAHLLGGCLKALFTITDYPNYEVIVVDTNSVEPATFALYEQYQKQPGFKLVQYPKIDFNFSKACNLGAAHAQGDLFLFLNNDTEAIHADWLSLMAQWFFYPNVGIVGPKLLYPDGKIQHAGVIVGLSGLVNHIMRGAEENSLTIFGSDRWYRNFLAVTGACLMISRAVFTEIQGFSEEYLLNFSDVELCLRAIEHGYNTIYVPDVRLLHHEGQTHRFNLPAHDFELASRDYRYWLIQGDPFFNPNLSYTDILPHKNRLPFTSPYPNHLMAMKRIRNLAKKQANTIAHRPISKLSSQETSKS